MVEELYQGLEKYAEAVDALPELEQKTQLAEESALRKLQEIRPHATRLEEAEHYRLPLMASAAVERLAEEYGQIRLDRETAGAAVQSRLADLEKAKRSLEKLGPMLDTGSLQRLVNRIRAHGALEKQHHDKLLEIAQLEESLSSQLERLPLWERPLEELASAQLPLEVTVEGCIQTERELDEKLARVKQEMEALEKQAGELRRQIGLLRTTGAVPSEKDLALARARRDHGWKLVRKAWLDKQPDVAGELEFSPDRPLPEAYEDSVTQADRISDELRRESIGGHYPGRKANWEGLRGLWRKRGRRNRRSMRSGRPSMTPGRGSGSLCKSFHFNLKRWGSGWKELSPLFRAMKS